MNKGRSLSRRFAALVALISVAAACHAEDLRVDTKIKASRLDERLASDRLGKAEPARKPEEGLSVAGVKRERPLPSRVAARSLRATARARKTKRVAAIQK